MCLTSSSLELIACVALQKPIHCLMAGLLFLSASGSSINCFGNGEGGLFILTLNQLVEESLFLTFSCNPQG